MVAQRRPLLLLANDAGQAAAHIVRQHHTGERHLRVGALDQSLQLAARACERDRRLTARRTAAPPLVARLLDKPLKLVRIFGAALPGLLCSDLQGDREKLLFVALDVRVQEREQMLRRHVRLLFSAAMQVRPTNF